MTGLLDQIAIGSCPTCGGPAQTIDRRPDVPFGLEVRHVALPNMDADLGDGWTLMSILPASNVDDGWRANAEVRRGRLQVAVEHGYGDTPGAAYLALRTAIERRA